MRPASRIGKLIPAKPPRLHFPAHIRRHSWTGCQISQEPFGVIQMFLLDARARGIILPGVIIIPADVIRGKATVIVDIGFVRRDQVDTEKIAKGDMFVRSGEGIKIAAQHFVL